MPILLYIALWSCAFGMASCLSGLPENKAAGVQAKADA
jgi:hypothetical protein